MNFIDTKFFYLKSRYVMKLWKSDLNQPLYINFICFEENVKHSRLIDTNRKTKFRQMLNKSCRGMSKVHNDMIQSVEQMPASLSINVA